MMLAFFYVRCYNSNMEKTIVSISTPLGKGAISIVRMSGERALEIASKLFSTKSLDYKNIEPRKMYLGKFELDKKIHERCLMVYFKAPYSYTGEDIVEFQIHGGIIITQKILEKCLQKGAVLAEAGEFSKRAFINGKISLDEAESIIDVIDSESESELKASLSLAGGGLFKQVKEMQNHLTEILAKIEVTLDYPEEDVDEAVREDIFNEIYLIKCKIEKILKDSESSKYIKNGINVSIVGKTNVGKSSLLNSLLNENKAIVTNIEGTTRDSIEASFYYKGIKINLIDTAGIRETVDEVERIGIERSKESLKNADITLFVLDGSEEMTENDRKIRELIEGKIYISVINKCDMPRKLEKQKNEIEISALSKKNIEELKEKIFNLVIKEEINFNNLIVTNQRQLSELNNALNVLEEIYEARDQMLEIIAMLIKKLWETLGKITGNTENENIIDLIFSKFCLGK